MAVARRVAASLLAGVALAGCTLLLDTAGLSGPLPSTVLESGTGQAIDAASLPADAAASDVGATASDAAPSDAGADATASDGLFDDFERADGVVLGNGWTEKVPSAFFLANGRVKKPASPTDYRDNLVYRPPSEDRRDVELAVEFELQALGAFPQAFLRVRRATIAAVDSYDGYIFYIDSASSHAVIGRQRGTKFAATLTSLLLKPALVPGHRYRLTVSARGQTPVALTMRCERLESGQALESQSFGASDSALDRLQDAGALGFASDDNPDVELDNFRWNAL